MSSRTNKIQLPRRGNFKRNRNKRLGPQIFSDRQVNVTLPSWLNKTLFAPYVDLAKFNWIIYLRSMAVELLFATILYFVGTMAVGLALKTGVNVFLAAIGVGAAISLTYSALTSGRQAVTNPLPRLLNPAFYLSEAFHQRIGLVPGLGYLIAQVGASFAASGLLAWLSAEFPVVADKIYPRLNFLTNAQAVADGGAMSTFTAYAFTCIGSLLIAWAYYQEHTIDDNKRQYQPTRILQSRITGAVMFAVIAVHYYFGVWQFNPGFYIAPAASWIADQYYAGVVAIWPIEFFMPLLGFLLAVVLHWLTHNYDNAKVFELDDYTTEPHYASDMDEQEEIEGDGIARRYRKISHI